MWFWRRKDRRSRPSEPKRQESSSAISSPAAASSASSSSPAAASSASLPSSSSSTSVSNNESPSTLNKLLSEPITLDGLLALPATGNPDFLSLSNCQYADPCLRFASSTPIEQPPRQRRPPRRRIGRQVRDEDNNEAVAPQTEASTKWNVDTQTYYEMVVNNNVDMTWEFLLGEGKEFGLTEFSIVVSHIPPPFPSIKNDDEAGENDTAQSNRLLAQSQQPIGSPVIPQAAAAASSSVIINPGYHSSDSEHSSSSYTTSSESSSDTDSETESSYVSDGSESEPKPKPATSTASPLVPIPAATPKTHFEAEKFDQPIEGTSVLPYLGYSSHYWLSFIVRNTKTNATTTALERVSLDTLFKHASGLLTANLHINAQGNSVRITLHSQLPDIGQVPSGQVPSCPLQGVSLSLRGFDLSVPKKAAHWEDHRLLFSSDQLHARLVEAILADSTGHRLRFVCLESLCFFLGSRPGRLRSLFEQLDLSVLLKRMAENCNPFIVESTSRVLHELFHSSDENRRRILTTIFDVLPWFIDNSMSIGILVPLIAGFRSSEGLAILRNIVRALEHVGALVYQSRSASYNILRKLGVQDFVFSSSAVVPVFRSSAAQSISPAIGDPDFARHQSEVESAGVRIYPSRAFAGSHDFVNIGINSDIVDLRWDTAVRSEAARVSLGLRAPALVKSISLQIFCTDFATSGNLEIFAWGPGHSRTLLCSHALVPKERGGGQFESSTMHFVTGFSMIIDHLSISITPIVSTRQTQIIRATVRIFGQVNAFEGAETKPRPGNAQKTFAELTENITVAQSKLAELQEQLREQLTMWRTTPPNLDIIGSISKESLALVGLKNAALGLYIEELEIQPDAPPLPDFFNTKTSDDRIFYLDEAATKLIELYIKISRSLRRAGVAVDRVPFPALLELMNTVGRFSSRPLFAALCGFIKSNLTSHSTCEFAIALVKLFCTTEYKQLSASDVNYFPLSIIADAIDSLSTALPPRRRANIIQKLLAIAVEQVKLSAAAEAGRAPDIILLVSALTLVNSQIFSSVLTSHAEREHEYSRCSYCGISPITGVRYRCSQCIDFDICEDCERETGHPVWHPLVVINEPLPPPPSSAVVSKVKLSSALLQPLYSSEHIAAWEQEKFNADCGAESSSSSSSSSSTSTTFDGQPFTFAQPASYKQLVHAHVKCDCCSSAPIRGARYHCLSCDDFDICHDCLTIVKHPASHHFVRLYLPLPGQEEQLGATPKPWVPIVFPLALYPSDHLFSRRVSRARQQQQQEEEGERDSEKTQRTSSKKSSKQQKKKGVATRALKQVKREIPEGRQGLMTSMLLPSKSNFGNDDDCEPVDPDLSDSDFDESEENDGPVVSKFGKQPARKPTTQTKKQNGDKNRSPLPERTLSSCFSIVVAAINDSSLPRPVLINSLKTLLSLLRGANIQTIHRDVVSQPGFKTLFQWLDCSDSSLRWSLQDLMSVIFDRPEPSRILQQCQDVAREALFDRLRRQKNKALQGLEFVLRLLLLVTPPRQAAVRQAAHIEAVLESRKGLVASAPMPLSTLNVGGSDVSARDQILLLQHVEAIVSSTPSTKEAVVFSLLLNLLVRSELDQLFANPQLGELLGRLFRSPKSFQAAVRESFDDFIGKVNNFAPVFASNIAFAELHNLAELIGSSLLFRTAIYRQFIAPYLRNEHQLPDDLDSPRGFQFTAGLFKAFLASLGGQLSTFYSRTTLEVASSLSNATFSAMQSVCGLLSLFMGRGAGYTDDLETLFTSPHTSFPSVETRNSSTLLATMMWSLLRAPDSTECRRLLQLAHSLCSVSAKVCRLVLWSLCTNLQQALRHAHLVELLLHVLCLQPDLYYDFAVRNGGLDALLSMRGGRASDFQVPQFLDALIEWAADGPATPQGNQLTAQAGDQTHPVFVGPSDTPCHADVYKQFTGLFPAAMLLEVRVMMSSAPAQPPSITIAVGPTSSLMCEATVESTVPLSYDASIQGYVVSLTDTNPIGRWLTVGVKGHCTVRQIVVRGHPKYIESPPPSEHSSLVATLLYKTVEHERVLQHLVDATSEFQPRSLLSLITEANCDIVASAVKLVCAHSKTFCNATLQQILGTQAFHQPHYRNLVTTICYSSKKRLRLLFTFVMAHHRSADQVFVTFADALADAIDLRCQRSGSSSVANDLQLSSATIDSLWSALNEVHQQGSPSEQSAVSLLAALVRCHLPYMEQILLRHYSSNNNNDNNNAPMTLQLTKQNVALLTHIVTSSPHLINTLAASPCFPLLVNRFREALENLQTDSVWALALLTLFGPLSFSRAISSELASLIPLLLSVAGPDTDVPQFDTHFKLCSDLVLSICNLHPQNQERIAAFLADDNASKATRIISPGRQIPLYETLFLSFDYLLIKPLCSSGIQLKFRSLTSSDWQSPLRPSIEHEILLPYVVCYDRSPLIVAPLDVPLVDIFTYFLPGTESTYSRIEVSLKLHGIELAADATLRAFAADLPHNLLEVEYSCALVNVPLGAVEKCPQCSSSLRFAKPTGLCGACAVPRPSLSACWRCDSCNCDVCYECVPTRNVAATCVTCTQPLVEVQLASPTTSCVSCTTVRASTAKWKCLDCKFDTRVKTMSRFLNPVGSTWGYGGQPDVIGFKVSEPVTITAMGAVGGFGSYRATIQIFKTHVLSSTYSPSLQFNGAELLSSATCSFDSYTSDIVTLSFNEEALVQPEYWHIAYICYHTTTNSYSGMGGQQTVAVQSGTGSIVFTFAQANSSNGTSISGGQVHTLLFRSGTGDSFRTYCGDCVPPSRALRSQTTSGVPPILNAFTRHGALSSLFQQVLNGLQELNNPSSSSQTPSLPSSSSASARSRNGAAKTANKDEKLVRLAWAQWSALMQLLSEIPSFITAYLSANESRRQLLLLLTGDSKLLRTASPTDIIGPLIGRLSDMCKGDKATDNRIYFLQSGLLSLVLTALSFLTGTSHVAAEQAMFTNSLSTAINALAEVKPSVPQALNPGRNHYWAAGTGYGSGEMNDDWNQEDYMQAQIEKHEHAALLVNFLSDYLLFTEGDSEVPTSSILEVLRASCLLPVVEAYLRNDSVLEIMRFAKLYRAVYRLIVVFSDRRSLWPLLTPAIRQLVGNMSQLASLIKRGMGLAPSQMEREEADELEMAKLLADTAAHVTARLSAADDKGKARGKGKSKGKGKQSIVNEYLQVMQPLQFLEASVQAQHHYSSEFLSAPTSSRAKMRRIVQELGNFSTGLPLFFGSSCFVRVDPNRLDVLKAVITGPEKTPYSGGVFEFHIFLPADYPESAPHINLETTGHQTVRFNPNLYNCGKVCLSLLGTWSGAPNEKWTKTSTLLQVLISIQSLILVPEPYFNEPGYESSRNTTHGDQASQHYNEEIRFQTCRWAIIEQMRKPPAGFEAIIHEHFRLKGDLIFAELEKWAEASKKPSHNWSTLLSDYTKEFRRIKAIGPYAEDSSLAASSSS